MKPEKIDALCDELLDDIGDDAEGKKFVNHMRSTMKAFEAFKQGGATDTEALDMVRAGHARRHTDRIIHRIKNWRKNR